MQLLHVLKYSGGGGGGGVKYCSVRTSAAKMFRPQTSEVTEHV